MDATVSLGYHLVTTNDKLEVISLVDLYEKISHADSVLCSQQEILRSVRQMDTNKYSQLKRALPYFVCGKFENGIRKEENFSSLESFVLDIDHFEENGVSIEELKQHLAQDDHVAMTFISPSGTGLKLLFCLDEPCRDANIYSAFYKRFAVEFAKANHLENYVDYQTCDVTRACFLASDPNAIVNLNHIDIHLGDFVNTEAVDLFVNTDKKVSNECQTLIANSINTHRCVEPDSDVMNKLREKLEMSRSRLPVAPQKEFYVPDEVKSIFDGLKTFVEETGVELYEARGIQYGMKLFFRVKLLRAELNVFYGKRGFSVVESPKKGTSSELNGMMAELVRNYILEHTELQVYEKQLRIG